MSSRMSCSRISVSSQSDFKGNTAISPVGNIQISPAISHPFFFFFFIFLVTSLFNKNVILQRYRLNVQLHILPIRFNLIASWIKSILFQLHSSEESGAIGSWLWTNQNSKIRSQETKTKSPLFLCQSATVRQCSAASARLWNCHHHTFFQASFTVR